MSITVPSTRIASGTSVQASAKITSGTGVSSPVTDAIWSTSSALNATVSSTGLVTAIHSGTATITATSGSSVAHVTVTTVPGAPDRVVVYSGSGQSGTKGYPLPDPLCTNVVDAANNRIINAVVTYVVATGGGQLADPTAPRTDNAGIATSGRWTLGTGSGTQTVTASSAGATSTTFTATAQ
jgi:hypothetical protein